MRHQLAHLTDVASRPGVELQILPFDAGPYASLSGMMGNFSFPHADPDVAYVDTVSGALFLERDTDVRAMSMAFQHPSATALSPAQSIDLIKAAGRRGQNGVKDRT